MKKILLLTTMALLAVSCGEYASTQSADPSGMFGFSGCCAMINSDGMLIVGVDSNGGDMDDMAQQFLEDAKNQGMEGINGCMVVSNNDMANGDIDGKVLGEAY